MVINADNLSNFAYTNGKFLNAVKGIVVEFHGLGVIGSPRDVESDKDASEAVRWFTEHEILYILPYYGPWCWMNDTAVRYVGEVIDVAIAKFKVPADSKLVTVGTSMGGLASLVYACKSKIRPVACAACCPVCDLIYHFNERDDLPRTLYSAFGHYPCSLEEAMRANSPLYMMDEMPEIEYLVIHGNADRSVNKEMHSDRFVAKLKEHHHVQYIEVDNMGHTGPAGMGKDVERKYYDFILKAIL